MPPEVAMRIRRATVAGVLVLGAAGCASGHRGGEEHEGLERVEATRVSLPQAIRSASAGSEGFVAVAAGFEEEGAGRFEIALLSGGRVREVAVDAVSGKVELQRERPVRAGHEEFASRLERMLPSARIDLARAVESSLAAAPGARTLGIQMNLLEDRLVYEVSLLTEEGPRDVRVDASDGSVLVTESAEEEGEEHEEGEMDEQHGAVEEHGADEDARGGEEKPGDLTSRVMFLEQYEAAVRYESERRLGASLL
jgi:uncharacterized membrane protein YkoI